jgi:hypothetical protein
MSAVLTLQMTQVTLHMTQVTLHMTQDTLHMTQVTLHMTQVTLHMTQFTLHMTQVTLHMTQVLRRPNFGNWYGMSRQITVFTKRNKNSIKNILNNENCLRVGRFDKKNLQALRCHTTISVYHYNYCLSISSIVPNTQIRICRA